MKQTYMFSRLQELQRIDTESLATRSQVVESAPSGQPTDDLDIDLLGIFHILLRRKRWIIGSILLSLTVSVLVCAWMKPQYIATSRLQLLSQEMGRLSLGDSESNSGLDALDSYSSLQTFVTVLNSDKLAIQVIHELHLMDIPEFQYSPRLKTAKTENAMSEPFERSAVKRSVGLNRFHTSLSVEAVPGTRVLAISYTDTDPELAAAIVNRLVSDFVEYNFRLRYDATTKGMGLLSQQMVKLKSDVEKSEARAAALQRASGMFGTDGQHNIIVDRLDQLNTQLVSAQQNRIAKEIVYKLAKTGNPEIVANLLGSSAGSTSSATSSQGTPLINQLRQREVDLDLEYADAASKYGAAYPRMVEMGERRAAVRASIQAELSRISERAQSEFQLAQAQEEAARRAFAEQQVISDKMNDRLIDYVAAKNEADDTRQIYDHLLQKLNEAGVLAGLRSSEMNILDLAEVPGSPMKPRKRLYLGLGAASGMILGLLLAFTSEAMDCKTRKPEEIEMKVRRPVLGIIPLSEETSNAHFAFPRTRMRLGSASSGSESTIALDRPVSEAFRSVRTRLLLASPHTPMEILLVTSAMQGDGNTFTSLNLAKSLSQKTRGDVLLVDADMREARLSKTLDGIGECGLADVLSGMKPSNCYRKLETIPGVMFLPAGSIHGDGPAEMLGSKTMVDLIRRWRKEFTHVVIDSPPLLPVADAVILSSLVDGVILLARYGFTDIRCLLRAARVLEDVNARCLGVLLNGMDTRSAEYNRYTGPRDNVSEYAGPPLLTRVLRRNREGDVA